MVGKVVVFTLLVVVATVSGQNKGGKIRLCARYCPPTGEVVCGTDGVTYPSECHLHNVRCSRQLSLSVDHPGPCDQGPILCAKYCPPGGDPVCGTNAKTYESQCHLENESCAYPHRQLSVRHTGRCRPGCPAICTADYTPVCGSDGKTYSNTCALDAAARCDGVLVTHKHDGPCRPGCPAACTADYTPVCGSDGKTYSNACALNTAARCDGVLVTLKHDGPCRQVPVLCAKYCPPIKRPVCGTNGQTYDSKCHLENESCGNPGLSLQHEGSCRQVPVLCAKYCPPIKRPVCGTNGQTYDSKCHLENESCGNPGLGLKHEGSCRLTEPIKKGR